MENVLAWAISRNLRKNDNPARWRGLLQTQLPAPSKIKKVKHHAALPITEVGAFVKELRKLEGNGARALEFAILTAARSGEVLGATWSEIDLENKIWTIPAERMKAGKEHRVPLSSAAVKVLNGQQPGEGKDLIFPAPRGGQLSDMTLSAVTRRMGAKAVPHGFRSTFRDYWAAERTNYPRDAAEMALAHSIGNKVEAAYRRGDLFEKRRRLMDAWDGYCAGAVPAGEVVPIRREAALA